MAKAISQYFKRIFDDYLITEKQPGIRTYITGQPGATLRTAQIQLANEWASVAHPDTGLSVHGRVGNNRASISAHRTAEALDAMLGLERGQRRLNAAEEFPAFHKGGPRWCIK